MQLLPLLSLGGKTEERKQVGLQRHWGLHRTAPDCTIDTGGAVTRGHRLGIAWHCMVQRSHRRCTTILTAGARTRPSSTGPKLSVISRISKVFCSSGWSENYQNESLSEQRPVASSCMKSVAFHSNAWWVHDVHVTWCNESLFFPESFDEAIPSWFIKVEEAREKLIANNNQTCLGDIWKKLSRK